MSTALSQEHHDRAARAGSVPALILAEEVRFPSCLEPVSLGSSRRHANFQKYTEMGFDSRSIICSFSPARLTGFEDRSRREPSVIACIFRGVLQNQVSSAGSDTPAPTPILKSFCWWLACRLPLTALKRFEDRTGKVPTVISDIFGGILQSQVRLFMFLMLPSWCITRLVLGVSLFDLLYVYSRRGCLLIHCKRPEILAPAQWLILGCLLHEPQIRGRVHIHGNDMVAVSHPRGRMFRASFKGIQA